MGGGSFFFLLVVCANFSGGKQASKEPSEPDTNPNKPTAETRAAVDKNAVLSSRLRLLRPFEVYNLQAIGGGMIATPARYHVRGY